MNSGKKSFEKNSARTKCCQEPVVQSINIEKEKMELYHYYHQKKKQQIDGGVVIFFDSGVNMCGYVDI